MLSFFASLFDFLSKVFSFEVVRGITVETILFFNMFIISFWTAFTRRG